MYIPPTKATPGGCVVAFLGLFPVVIGILLSLAVWKGFQVPADERSEEWLSGILQLGGWGLFCYLLGLGIVVFGLRLTSKADLSDPYSGSKPTMRF